MRNNNQIIPKTTKAIGESANRYALSLPVFLGLLVLLLTSCGETPLPKPRGEVRLTYPEAVYKPAELDCPFGFEYARGVQLDLGDSLCWMDLKYKEMGARIHLTYQPVKNDLAKKIKNSERLAHEHAIKASFIAPQEFLFPEKRVFGTLFELGGESALNFQFHITDSLQHLVSGSLYFEVPPNPDSLQPAVLHIKKDIQHLVESFEWKK